MSMYLSTTSLMGPSVPSWLEDICQRLVDNDKNLQTVELTHPRIDDVFARIVAEALEENDTVTALILSCYAIVDDGAYAIGSVLGKNKSIQKLQLRDLRNQREVKTFFQSLLQNTYIEELSLRHSHICSQSASTVAAVLQKHPNLKEVRFVDCQIPVTSLRLLCEGIKHNRSIQRLYLINTEIDSEGAQEIADMLREGSCLRELYLCENNIGDEGVAALARGVLGNTSLQTLDLRSNGITANGALSIQGMIVSSQFLTGLCLSTNDLGNQGAAALARGLQHSDCILQRLDVGENGIDEAGASALANMLRVNTFLMELHMAFNSVGDNGALEMASALVINKTLRWLELRRNGISNVGAHAFANKLPQMHGLKELVLSKNNIDHNGAAALLEGLRNNTELEYLHVEEKVSEPIAREIVHWIRLNKAGRRIFRQPNVPDNLWPRVYGRISTDFEVLFHFLSEKPDVLLPTRKRRKLPEE